MSTIYGKKRVVISNVQPSVDCGQYPAKAVVAMPVTLSADIYADGHDRIAAEVLVKHTAERQWRAIKMSYADNDCWSASFTPDRLGIYRFRVQAWIDHFASWQHTLQKKQAARQDLSVELEIGKNMVLQRLEVAVAKDKSALHEWLSRMEQATVSDEQLNVAEDEGISALMATCQDKDAVSFSSPGLYELEVDVPRAQFSSWYELFPRSAAAEPGKHGTFRDVQALLPRIARMGFDVLYLPPIHPIGEKKRKGRNNSTVAEPGDPGSPWAIGSKLGGHKDINPDLGTPRDFKNLIRAAATHGIDIAMDIAFQCAPDHPYVAAHPQWFKWRPDGTVQYAENPPKKYEDILPFDFETEDREGLWEELRSVFLYWIKQGVSIFRVDNPHTKALPFWQWCIGEIKAQHPEVIFLSEAFTRPRIMEHLAKIGFTQSYTYFAWRHSAKELKEYMLELTKTPLRNYFRPNFWPNTPDILTPELAHGGEAAHIMRAILAATLSSSWGIYGPVYEYGERQLAKGKDEYADNEKYEIRHWNWSRYTKIREVISRLNRLRKENTALQQTDNIAFAASGNEQLLAYVKRDALADNTLVVVVNLDPHNAQGGMVDIPADMLGRKPGETYQLQDLLTGDRYEWRHGWNYVSLAPWDMPAHILKLIPQSHSIK